MAEVGNGVTGQDQSVNVLRNFRHYHHVIHDYYYDYHFDLDIKSEY